MRQVYEYVFPPFSPVRLLTPFLKSLGTHKNTLRPTTRVFSHFTKILQRAWITQSCMENDLVFI